MLKCATITISTPSTTSFLNGYISRESSLSLVKGSTGSPKCESTSVSPCPGKCFAEPAIPPSRIPRIMAIPYCATFSLSSPKDLVLIAGLLGLLLMSISGEKLTCIFSSRHSIPICLPISYTSESLLRAPSCMKRGKAGISFQRMLAPHSASMATIIGIFAHLLSWFILFIAGMSTSFIGMRPPIFSFWISLFCVASFFPFSWEENSMIIIWAIFSLVESLRNTESTCLSIFS